MQPGCLGFVLKKKSHICKMQSKCDQNEYEVQISIMTQCKLVDSTYQLWYICDVNVQIAL